MSQVNSLLSQRTKKSEHSNKMAEMAMQSANGKLSTFSGMFSVADLSSAEKSELEYLLHSYAIDAETIIADLNALVAITSEVKAINNQAALLHGERIKRVQEILTRYRDGAFTAWLVKTYGNRQTPYNFLQYYLFYEAVPPLLRTRLETMPRQAVYTLASREVALTDKQSFIEAYAGETKEQLLESIRLQFPISPRDRRGRDCAEAALRSLERVARDLECSKNMLKDQEKIALKVVLDRLYRVIS